MIVFGALRLATNEKRPLAALQACADLPGSAVVPAVVTLLAMLLLGRRLKKHWVVPSAIVLGCLTFYAVLAISGLPLAEARERGLLLAPAHLSSVQWLGGAPGTVRWVYILHYLPDMLAVAVVATVSILLDAMGIGVAANTEVDFNAELRAAGLANLAASAVSGVPGYLSISRTLLNWNAGATTRTSGITAALVLLSCVVALPGAIAYCPIPVLVGLLLFPGVMLVSEWAGKSLRRLPRFEYALLLIIAALVIAYGFVTAVLIGILAACALFVFNYGRITCIKAEFNGDSRASKVERTIEVVDIPQGARDAGLRAHAAGFPVFRHGELCVEPRERAAAHAAAIPRAGPEDGAGHECIRLARLHQALAALRESERPDRARGLSEDMHALLARSHAIAADTRVFADADEALEWVESDIIASARAGAIEKSTCAATWRSISTRASSRCCWGTWRLSSFWKDITCSARASRATACISWSPAQVKVSLPTADGGLLRLRSFGSGTIVGEMSLYAQPPRTADPPPSSRPRCAS